MIAYLKNEERIWEIPDGDSTVGRGSDCTLPLDAGRYPEISRKHVRFHCAGGVVTFRDDNSANGTLKNGVRLSSGELRPGDTLELGAGGPMFEMWQGPVGRQDVTTRIQNIAVERIATPAERAPERASGAARAAAATPVPPTRSAATPPSAPVKSEATTQEMPLPSAVRPSPVSGARPGDPAPLGGPAAELRTVTMPRATSGAKSFAREGRPSDDTTAVFEDQIYTPPPAPRSSAPHAPRIDDVLALTLEKKIDIMQKLVVGVLAMVFALCGLLLYQSHEIQQNRETILALQQQASSSVTLLMPQLDQRMNRLNERLDDIDPKLQKAEDHMADRMNHDLPILLDKYLASRMAQGQAMNALVPR
ncbi:FHA domain-containing protein [Granulicella rosea]|uniref:FHA domain-containing protein n=1 Tax=Granulicella rosea TaxID=474952 RepID=A0A239KN90_9BACT|nr:FHA domain-containing protein [Granulicella rosea]SNT19525.1 FHA domain-containing protein [Granulicella rosea]